MRLLSAENCLEKTFPEAFPKLTISDKKRNILLTLLELLADFTDTDRSVASRR